MKVLHVLDTSVPDTAGYTTRGYYLITHQKRLGVVPVVLTSERFSNPHNISEEMIDGVRYYRIEKKNSLVRKVPVVSELDEIRNLKRHVSRILDKEQVDIVHAHSPSLIGDACTRACSERNIPCIYEIRAFWEDAAVDRGAFGTKSWNYLLRKCHETKVVKRADAVVAICNGIKNDLVARGIESNKIYIVPNGVDGNLFHPIVPDLALREKLDCSAKFIIGFIGSFFNFEGLQTLVLAMKDISKEDRDIVLLLVGTGHMEKDLKDLVVANNLDNKVIFTGRVSHNQIQSYYSIIDLLVYPRIRRRITDLVTPLKPLEAMAMEKAVLMSNVGGLEELVDKDDIAVFFESEDRADLVKKCLQLSRDPELRQKIGKNARANVLDRWGWDRRARQSLEVYKSLVT